MELTDQLDLHKELTRASNNKIKWGIASLTVIPAAFYGLIHLVHGNEPGAPLFAWIVVGCCVLFGAVKLGSALHYKRHPDKHKAFRWTALGTPEKQWVAIEDDWNRTPAREKHHSDTWYVTPNWLLHRGEMDFATCPVRYVAWVYLTRTKRRVGTDYTLTVCCTDGHELSGDIASSFLADDLMQALHRRAPWAFYGYSKEFKESWGANREEFVNAVQLRIAQVEAGQQVPQPVEMSAVATTSSSN